MKEKAKHKKGREGESGGERRGVGVDIGELNCQYASDFFPYSASFLTRFMFQVSLSFISLLLFCYLYALYFFLCSGVFFSSFVYFFTLCWFVFFLNYDYLFLPLSFLKRYISSPHIHFFFSCIDCHDGLRVHQAAGPHRGHVQQPGPVLRATCPDRGQNARPPLLPLQAARLLLRRPSRQVQG